MPRHFCVALHISDFTFLEKKNTSHFSLSTMKEHVVAGAVQATLVTAVGYPFDTVKVNLQAKNAGSAWDITKNIVRQEGIRGLYKGGTMPLLSHLAKRPLQFPCSEYLKRNRPEGFGLGWNYIVGAVQGPLGSVFGTPLQVVKIRSQLETNTVVGHLKNVIGESGAKGLYRGFTATLAKDCLFSASFLGHYYTLRECWGSDKMYKNFINGATAHCATWMILIPIDFVKTNVQKSKTPTTISNVVSTTLKTHGPLAFWRGVVPACLRTIPVSGIAMIGYEATIDLFRQMK